ncbi:MAG: M16 family metallopeptidase [Prevotella sp.]
MKRLSIVLCCVFSLVRLLAQSPLEVRELKLSNGFTVWINEDHSQPKVYGAVVVKAGAKDCPNTGIAHYFEHLMFKGTDKMGTVDYAAEKPWLDSISSQYDLLAKTADPVRRHEIQKHINALSIKAADYAIPNEFENLITTYGGTGLNAYTSFDETVYHNVFAPQYIAQWCELNAERLVAPVFRLFQGELETVYEEKNMYADQMLVQAAEAAQRYALAGTPYAYPILGSTENLKNPRLSEMREFYDKYYVAGNMGLLLCGDVRADALKPLLESTFGRIRKGEAPQSPVSKIRDLRGSPTLKIKIPIPVVKAAGYAFKAPTEHSRDYVPFMVMRGMLSNGAKTGLLDSLDNENKLMGVMAGAYDFKDFSIFGFGYVPNLPFGTKKKADRLCWEQINRLRAGQFDRGMLDAEKLYIQRNMEWQLENVKSRSALMVKAFSHGISWSDVLNRSREVGRVTRDDIVRVARTYFNDDSLKVSKKFGRYPKERISQPGYKAVRPKNVGKKSAYAKQLAKMPRQSMEPKLVDFERDASCRRLSPLVNFYAVPNPMNDIFTLQLIYRRGLQSDARTGAMAAYLNLIGTFGHSKQQLGRALQRLGATLSVESADNSVKVKLSGFDGKMKEAMMLLHEFLTAPNADRKKFKNLVRSVRLEEKTFFNENADIASAVFALAQWGEQSPYLKRLTAKALKRTDGPQLVDLFKEVQHTQLDIVYTGNLPDAEVEAAVREYVPLDKVDSPRRQFTPIPKASSAPIVYIYDNPHARQTIVGTCHYVSPLSSIRDRMAFRLWGSYFGQGMSSVLFQEIREFRSYAYYARGYTNIPDFKTNADKPCCYLTRLGTQADKTMDALGVLDSLLSDMPVHETNVSSARQEIINGVNNGYPAFRSMGSYVADASNLDYTEDPNRRAVEILPTLTLNDLTAFYHRHIQKQPFATIIVGNKKLLDLQKLRQMGKLVFLKSSDIYRK